MKRLTLLALVAVLALGTIAAGKAADKATGTVHDTAEERTFQFDAHAEAEGPRGQVRPAKGWARADAEIFDPSRYWEMDVVDVHVHDNKACFIGPVTESNAVSAGQWMRVTVEDNGPPGLQVEPDKAAYRSATQTDAEDWLNAAETNGCPDTISGGVSLTIDEGNLTVHNR